MVVEIADAQAETTVPISKYSVSVENKPTYGAHVRKSLSTTSEQKRISFDVTIIMKIHSKDEGR